MSTELPDLQESKPGDAAGPNRGRKEERTHWSSWLICLSACLLVVVVSRNIREAYQQHQRLRSVRCDEPVFDFGQAFVGGQIDHTFHVTNVSRSPLQIEKVLSSCGCTTVATELEGTSIEPDESFDVPVQLSLSSQEEGEFERPVIIRFAGEPRLQVTLKLKGNVEKRWTWSKEKVIFNGIPADEPVTRTIELTQNPDAPPDEVTYLSGSSQSLLDIAFENHPASSSGPASCLFIISTMPTLPPGRHEATFHAYTAASSVPLEPVRIILIVE